MISLSDFYHSYHYSYFVIQRARKAPIFRSSSNIGFRKIWVNNVTVRVISANCSFRTGKRGVNVNAILSKSSIPSYTKKRSYRSIATSGSPRQNRFHWRYTLLSANFTDISCFSFYSILPRNRTANLKSYRSRESESLSGKLRYHRFHA